MLAFGTVDTNAATVWEWPPVADDPGWCCCLGRGYLGVMCGETGRIIALSMMGSYLYHNQSISSPISGRLDRIGALTELKFLYLQGNELTGDKTYTCITIYQNKIHKDMAVSEFLQ